MPERASDRAECGNPVMNLTVARDVRPSSSAPATNSTRAEGIANHSTGDLYGQQEPSPAALCLGFNDARQGGKEFAQSPETESRAACGAGRKAASEASSHPPN